MRSQFFALLIFSSFTAFAQNVGIGTTTPTEKLDVSGNINVDGIIKIGNTSGKAGQVLMTNASGKTLWGNLSEYKNTVMLTSVGDGTWKAPAGVYNIVAELWGGGGGGNGEAGGGSGGYLAAHLSVSPNTVYDYTVGIGGLGQPINPTAGQASTFLVGGISFSALGGGAATTASNFAPGGAGGGWQVSNGFTNFIAYNGQAGFPVDKTYMQVNATTFFLKVKSGRGGNAPGVQFESGGYGVDYTGSTVGSATVYDKGIGPGARQPGGGGGSLLVYNLNGSTFTYNPGTINGGNGMIVIHY